MLRRAVSAAVVLAIGAAAPAEAATATFSPSADSYVDASRPSTNFGTQLELRTDGSPVMRSYLRFDVQGISGPVTKATLSLVASNSFRGAVTSRAVSGTSWSETGITNANAPATGAALSSVSSIAKGARTSFAVTGAVAGNGAVSFALTSTLQKAVAFSSREAGGAGGPQLVVESTATPPDTTAPSPPSGLTATAGDTKVSLGWGAATDNVGVTGYRVYRRNPDGTWPTAGTGSTAASTRTFTDTGLANGTAYTYRVTAVDAAGNQSAPSTTASATPQAPTPPPQQGPCGTAPVRPAAWQHVVWIVMENHSYSQVIGSSSAPYENALAGQCGLATNYFAITHPSLPNYVAMTSGNPQGITDDNPPSSHPLGVASIFSQLGTGGWRSLQESMPSNCLLTNSGQYAVKHNPAAYYTNIRTDCQNYDVPLGATPDISARFTFVTPNLCNDTHDCSVTTGDDWLKAFIPKLTSSPQYQSGTTAIFLTWDEDDSASGNQVATIVIAPSTITGTKSAVRFSHYSLLRTTEEMLGLTTYLGGAASAASMRSAFNL
ncbi:MAG TPA: alkaline phosphatase family protein [Mycobacteriales bacterium]